LSHWFGDDDEMLIRQKPVLERAFELARSGSFVHVEGLARALRKEGYTGVELVLAPPSLRKQLRAIIRARIAES